MKLPTLRPKRRSAATLTVDAWLQQIAMYHGIAYPLTGGTLTQNGQELGEGLDGLVQAAYRENGVVFACMLTRMLVFSEARFQFRQIRNGRPGDLFGNGDLRILEKPWANGTTGDLLTRAIQDADASGNFYLRRDGDRLQRMRPDWVTIGLGSRSGGDPRTALDSEVIGYGYHPGGPTSGEKVIALLPEEVAHFAPIPDPLARYRGMSWLTPIIREIFADKAATQHKLKFFENGATVNHVVTFDPSVQKEAFDAWVDAIEDKHTGLQNAYKTMYLGGGATLTAIGADMKQIDFKVVQGAGETRIAAAAGVPPVIVGLSEGLQAATYSNYGQARRRFADGTMRPLWRNLCGSLASILAVPSDSELWYDDRDIAFLREDEKDAAESQQVHASSIKTLVDAGYDADSVIDAVTSGDLARLKGKHTGLYSVQLQPAGSTKPPAAE